MDDSQVQDHIEALVAEERQLFSASGREGGHTAEERASPDEPRRVKAKRVSHAVPRFGALG